MLTEIAFIQMIRKQIFKTLTLPTGMFLIFIGLGLWLAATNLYKKHTWIYTTGTVSDIKPDKKGKDRFYPVVEFAAATGEIQTAEVKMSFSRNRLPYKKGDRVPVIYPPDNPETALINNFIVLFSVPCIFILLGTIGLLLPSELFYVS